MSDILIPLFLRALHPRSSTTALLVHNVKPNANTLLANRTSSLPHRLMSPPRRSPLSRTRNTQHPSPEPESYIFSSFNQPFAPADRRHTEEIMRDLSHDYHADMDGISMASVRRTLLKSWREVTDEIAAVERRR